jgi:hypothetical protein
VNDPPSAQRRHTRYTEEEIATFAGSLREIPPAER